ncbi:hypothetical protein L3Q82_019599 [Scortum barcoo]|uniref:Uncharacterized protein n=1 Tax=Scortum barcoo TaxID=214431 RepID=A0ACB8VBM1_9TELE|nr:hypothetical protein L3Q82_019599 [Scortum barcoo]
MYWSGLQPFAAEKCEAAGMRISTSKSEAMVLDRKRVAWHALSSVRSYAVGVPDRRGVVKKELSRKAKALDLPTPSIYVLPPSPMVMNFG